MGTGAARVVMSDEAIDEDRCSSSETVVMIPVGSACTSTSLDFLASLDFLLGSSYFDPERGNLSRENISTS